MFLVLGYAFVCGLKVPVVRASIMFICLALSLLLRRRPLVFNSLALSGLISLFLRPADIFSISFQLSYIAVFSIAVGFRYCYVIKRSVTLREKIKVLFLSSVFVNLGLMPLISFYWGKIYILNIFTDLGYVFYPLRLLLSTACGFLVSLFLRLNYFLANIPLSYLQCRFTPAAMLVYYTLIITFLVLLRLRRFNPRY